MRLRPVLAPFSTDLLGVEAVREGRRHGREALVAAAREAGAADWTPERDEKRAPIPTGGWHWTNTNTRGLAAALVAPFPVGIDTEWLHRPRVEAARRRFERDDPGELARLGGRGREEVLRLWTAKEAVLKLTGVGIADLGRTVLTAVLDGERLRLTSRDVVCGVQVRPWGEHLVAVAYPAALEVTLELVPLESTA